MALLTKDLILAADDRAHEDVEVPEWGGTVRVAALSGTARDAYEGSFHRTGPNGKPLPRDLSNLRSKLLARSIVGEDGERLFTDAEVKALGAKNGAVLDRLFTVAKQLSGIGTEAAEAAEGKSAPTPSVDSPSA